MFTGTCFYLLFMLEMFIKIVYHHVVVLLGNIIVDFVEFDSNSMFVLFIFSFYQILNTKTITFQRF